MINNEMLDIIDTMTPEEFNALQAKVKQREINQLSQRTTNNEDTIKKQGKAIDILQKDNDKKTKDIDALKTIVNVLRNDNTGKLEEYKRNCMLKIKNLLRNDKTGAEYILFNDCYRCWIYADIHHTLNVPKADCINIDDYELALGLIKKWRPTTWQKNKKIQEYIKLQEKGKLNLAKSKSLDEYLEKTQGGISA